MSGGARGERGAVTAETAMVMPLLAAVTVGLVWVIAVAGAQVRTVDAAREAARQVARGEPPSAAEALARRAAPDGASVHVSVVDGVVTVRVQARVGAPGGVFSRAGTTVASTAVAALEPEAGP